MSEASKQELIKQLYDKMDGTPSPYFIIAVETDEFEFFENHFIKPIEETEEKSKYDLFISLADMCIGGYAIGLMPSDCYRDLPKISEHFAYQTGSGSSKNGLVLFWLVCLLLSNFLPDGIGSLGKSEITNFMIKLLGDVFEDFSLPRKIYIAAHQLRINCHISQSKYHEALLGLQGLEEYLYSPKGKGEVIRFIGYVSALRDYDIQIELDSLMLIDIPEEEYAENSSQKIIANVPLDMHIAIAKRMLEEITKSQKEGTERVIQSINQSKREIMGSSTQTPDNVRERLVKQYGDWIDGLNNQGALVNAEFLFGALDKRSWGEVVMGYSNCAEGEIRNNLIEPLQNWLTAKNKSNKLSLKSRAFTVEVKKDMTLYDFGGVLTEVTSNRDLKEFLLLFPREHQEFISGILPSALKRIIQLRNPSAHGGIAASAKEIKQIVLGTPEKSGILKQLSEIKRV